ncbi:uncharacterized protein LOC143150516 [Ptiloglossa arizonensis]|uniref:uncharacterized protein LOC143150516 n=1 Tax=Ptiloglossa arizonensis TaxID=3350558 RepID=UPI003F9F8816
MPTIAESPTTQNPAQPLFIECNGPYLGLDDMPIRIKAPPVSDDEDNHSTRYDFQSNYDDIANKRTLKEEDTSSVNDTVLGETNYRSLTNDAKNDLVSSGIMTDSALLTEIKEIKEEPCPNSPETQWCVPVTDPVPQSASMFVPVDIKNETDSFIADSDRSHQQDGSKSRNIGTIGTQRNSEQTKSRKKKTKSLPMRKMRPILPKPIVSSNGEIIRLETFDLKISKVNSVEKEKEQVMRTKRHDCQKLPTTDTPRDETGSSNLRTVCPYCHNTYSTENVMDTHFRRMHKNHYRCKKCQYIYESQDILDEHYKLHERNSTPLQCASCKNKYKHPWGLRQHQIRAHSTVEPNAIPEEGSMYFECGRRKPNQYRRKTYTCEYCDNTYPQYSHLVAHERITHGIQDKRSKEFRCNVCKKYFCSEESLRRHGESHERRYTCDHCGKKFREKYILKLHIRKHTGEKPYQCKVCFRRYAELGVLRVHKLTHTGERPYVCNVCGRSFTQRCSMMIHYRKHPGNHPPPAPVSLANLDSDGD